MNNYKQVFSLVALFASGFMTTAVLAGGDITAGKKKAESCFACHGEKGISTAPDMYPHLAGQHASYLLHAMKDYKEGRRQNQIMSGMAEPLSEQDMEDIAAYYASMPGLVTPPREPAASSE